jgi:regulator of replication initiation timing
MKISLTLSIKVAAIALLLMLSGAIIERAFGLPTPYGKLLAFGVYAISPAFLWLSQRAAKWEQKEAELTDSLELAVSDVRKLSEKWRECERKMSEALEANKGLASRLDLLVPRLDLLTEEHGSLKLRFTGAKAEIDSLKVRLEVADRSLADMSKTAQARMNECERLRNENDTLRKDLAATALAAEQVEELKAKNVSLTNTVNAYKKFKNAKDVEPIID